jgi:hypothetical protein
VEVAVETPQVRPQILDKTVALVVVAVVTIQQGLLAVQVTHLPQTHLKETTEVAGLVIIGLDQVAVEVLEVLVATDKAVL